MKHTAFPASVNDRRTPAGRDLHVDRLRDLVGVPNGVRVADDIPPIEWAGSRQPLLTLRRLGKCRSTVHVGPVWYDISHCPTFFLVPAAKGGAC